MVLLVWTNLYTIALSLSSKYNIFPIKIDHLAYKCCSFLICHKLVCFLDVCCAETTVLFIRIKMVPRLKVALPHDKSFDD